MHDRALEAEPGDGALQFGGGGYRVGSRQRSESGETVGMGGDGFGETVIGATREPHGKLGIRHFLRARRGVRQNLNVDAGRVHLGNAALADIVEAGHDMRPSRRIDPGGMPFHLGIEVVLFKRDHLRSHAHFFLPAPSPGWDIVTIRRRKIEPRR